MLFDSVSSTKNQNCFMELSNPLPLTTEDSTGSSDEGARERQFCELQREDEVPEDKVSRTGEDGRANNEEEPEDEEEEPMDEDEEEEEEDARKMVIEEETANTSPSLPELNIAAESPSSQILSLTEEDGSKKILKCDYCDKTFTLANVLKVHQRIHTGEKPYVCEICGKAFNQSGSLNRHRNTHRYRDCTDNNFICRFCSAQFPHGSLLENHEKTAHHNRRSGRPRNLLGAVVNLGDGGSNNNSTGNGNNNAATTNNNSGNSHGHNIQHGSIDAKLEYLLSNHEMPHLTAPAAAPNDKLSCRSHDDDNSSQSVVADSPDNNNHGNLGSASVDKDGHSTAALNMGTALKREFTFTCPYCQLEMTDIREFGMHLTQHNLSGLLPPPALNPPSNSHLIPKSDGSIFSSESLLSHLNSISNKMKLPLPINSEFGSPILNTAQFSNSMLPMTNSSFPPPHPPPPPPNPLSFDRSPLTNLNFPPHSLPNHNNLPIFPPDSYNLAAFLLATLSKDYLYKLRSVQQTHNGDNPNMAFPNPEFLKGHIFQNPNKSPLLNPSNNPEFYHNLFNLQKPIQNFFGNVPVENSNNHTSLKYEHDPNNNSNMKMPNSLLTSASTSTIAPTSTTAVPCTPVHTSIANQESFTSAAHTTSPSLFLSAHSNSALSAIATIGISSANNTNNTVSHVNASGKSSANRSSPASSSHTIQSSSKTTNDLFYSRKNPTERRRCPDCDKQFTCESALRIHYRKHSGERPYACEYCSKTFSQNGTLKRHHLTCKNRPNLLSASSKLAKLSSVAKCDSGGPQQQQQQLDLQSVTASTMANNGNSSSAAGFGQLHNSPQLSFPAGTNALSYILSSGRMAGKSLFPGGVNCAYSNSVLDNIRKSSSEMLAPFLHGSAINSMANGISSTVIDEPTDLTVHQSSKSLAKCDIDDKNEFSATAGSAKEEEGEVSQNPSIRNRSYSHSYQHHHQQQPPQCLKSHTQLVATAEGTTSMPTKSTNTSNKPAVASSPQSPPLPPHLPPPHLPRSLDNSDPIRPNTDSNSTTRRSPGRSNCNSPEAPQIRHNSSVFPENAFLANPDIPETESAVSTVRQRRRKHRKTKRQFVGLSTHQILEQLVHSNRLQTCRHCQLFFEPFPGRLKEHSRLHVLYPSSSSSESNTIFCRECDFPAPDSPSFQLHINTLLP